jgi:hypothetical protein
MNDGLCRKTSRITGRFAISFMEVLMRDQKFLWPFMIATAVGLSACATVGGKVANGIYTSPLYNFKVPVPDMGADTTVKDTANDQFGFVEFYDGHGSLLRIEYLRMGPLAAARHSDPERRGYAYWSYTHETFIPKWQAEFPGTEVLFDEYVGKDSWRSYFFVVYMPGGFAHADPETGRKRDTTTAYLIFSSGEFMYILSEEVLSENGGRDVSEASYRSMEARLIELGSTMNFE